jgi:hypothetical protein
MKVNSDIHGGLIEVVADVVILVSVRVVEVDELGVEVTPAIGTYTALGNGSSGTTHEDISSAEETTQLMDIKCSYIST